MLKIIYFIKSDKATKNGECPIYAKVQYQQQIITMSTKQRISPERWRFTNNLRNPLKLAKEKVTKSSLDSFALLFERKVNLKIRENLVVNLKSIKLEIAGQPKQNKPSLGLIDIFEEHNKAFERKVKVGDRSAASLQKYRRSQALIEAFLQKQYGQSNIPLKSVTGAFIYNLESYLKYDSIYKGKVGIQNNSVVKYFKNFKTVCNYGIKMDLISTNPFAKYDGKLKVKDAVFLTKLELSRIEEKRFSVGRLERVKDIFLFSCYTGYAPIDAQALTNKNLVENTNGDLWIVTNRVKSGIRSNVPVLPATLKIIKKYESMQAGLIPKLSNQKMNAYLKEIADLCRIDKKLTWYTARHTFATTITLGNGIKIENLSAMMGHTNIKQTQHYAKVLDSSVSDDMNRLSLILR